VALRTPRRLLRLLILAPLLFPSTGLSAQEEVQPVINGQVLAAGEALPDVLVVLHRVSSDFAGEIDSIQAGADGRFTLRLPRVPDHGVSTDVYFASVRYRGLLYFGEAITSPAQLDSLYIVQAYDTLSAPPGGARIPVAQRSLFLDKLDTGWQVTDVFQLDQDADRTLFSPSEGAVWSYPLPEGAQDFQVGQSEMAPDATRFADGRMELYSPIPPGERFYMVRYSLPQDDFTLPLPGETRRLEIMVREPGPEVSFPPLTPGPPVELEPGNVFRRFQGVGFLDSEIRANVQPPAFHLSAAWLAVLLAGLLGGAGVYAYRVRGGEPLPAAEAPEPRESLLLAVAALDEEFQSKEDPSARERQEYEARRAALLARLTAGT
jgi:hypothetical protein